MAVRKDIKVVLTLDDNGFSAKGRSAREVLRLLNSGLMESGKSTERFEKALDKLGRPLNEQSKQLKGIGANVQLTNKSVSDLVAEIRQLVSGLDTLKVKGSPAQRTLKEIESAAKDTGVSMAQLKPSLAAAASGFDALARSSTAATSQMKRDTKDRIAARIEEVQRELQANDLTLASRARLHGELRKLESETRAQAMAAQLASERNRRPNGQFISGSERQTMRDEAARLNANADAYGREIAKLDAAIPKMRQEQQARRDTIARLNEEAAARKNLDQIAAYVGRKNAEEVDRITREAARARMSADRAARDSGNELERSRIANLKRIAREERETYNQIAEMWKSLAGIYTAAKVEQGVGASVNSADAFQRQLLTLTGMGVNKEDLDYITKKAWDDSKVLKFASAIDLVRARIAFMGGLPNASRDVVDDLSVYAAKGASNMLTLANKGGKQASPEEFENMVRNIAGVIEMRGQTTNTTAAKSTIDLLQKSYIATGRKIDIADIETFLRRDATGADKITDKGLAEMIAFIDAAKVAGGGGGGGAAAGVSTVGTAVKMFQKMANGGLMTERAAMQFADAGLMDLSQIDGKTGKQAMRALRQGGLKDADLANAAPVEALEKIAKAAFEWMARPENVAKYFPKGDVNDETARKDAMAKFAIGTGWTTTATSMLTMAGNRDIMERAHAQRDMIMGSMGVDEFDAEKMKSYAGSVAQFDKALENLKITIGTGLLPILTEVFKWTSEVLGKFNEFGQSNPMLTTVLTITGALGGMVLGATSLLRLFGAGGLTAAFSGLATTIGGATVPAVAGLLATLGTLVKWVSGVAFAGLMGVVIGSWVKDIKVGGLTIQQILENSFANVAKQWRETIILMSKTWGGFTNYLEQRRIDLGSFMGFDMGKAKAAQDARNAALAGQNAKDQATSDALHGLVTHTAPPIKGGGDGKRMSAATDPRSFVNSAKQTEEARAAHKAGILAHSGPRVAGASLGKAGKTGEDGEVFGGLTPAQRAALATPDRKPRVERDHVNPLDRALEETIGEVNAQTVKIKSLLTGVETFRDIEQEALEKLEGRRKAGDFNQDHDKKNPVAADDPRFEALKKATSQKMLQSEQIKAMTFANERFAASEVEVGNAMLRLTDGTVEKQSEAFRALERDFARAEERLGAGARGWAMWEAAKARALSNRAMGDFLNLGADIQRGNLSAGTDMLPTERARTDARLRAEEEASRTIFDRRRDNAQRTYEMEAEAERKRLAEEAVTAEQRQSLAETTNRVLADLERRHNEQMQLVDAERTRQIEIEAEKRQRAMEEPIENLARRWKDVDSQLRDVQQDWAEGFIDSLMRGKAGMKDFATSVLTDITRMKLRETLADPLKDIITQGTNWLKLNVFAGGQTAGAKTTGDFARADRMNDAAEQAAGSLSALAVNGADKATEAMVQQVAQSTIQQSATDSASFAMASLTAAAQAAAAALGAVGATSAVSTGVNLGGAAGGLLDLFFSANGNVIGPQGAMTLKKYASGGIARSPQLSVFGEGSTPEAYVPLPDGRSIPVSMQGGGAAPEVTVNVINQSGVQVNAESGQPRMDGRKLVLDVVLTAMNQPGPFRDGMKGAMR